MWIDVESDGSEDLEISDSEDEGDKKDMKGKSKAKGDEEVAAPTDESTAARISSLATTKVGSFPLHCACTIDLVSLDPDSCGLRFAERPSPSSGVPGRGTWRRFVRQAEAGHAGGQQESSVTR